MPNNIKQENIKRYDDSGKLYYSTLYESEELIKDIEEELNVEYVGTHTGRKRGVQLIFKDE